MSTGVDWLLHLITVLVGTVSQMSIGVDYVDEQRNSQKGSVDTVSGMSTGVDSFFIRMIRKGELWAKCLLR